MKTVNIGDKPVSLNEDEMIIWQGRPVQGVLRNPAHIGWGLALLVLGFWLIIGRVGSLAVVGALLGLSLMLAGGYLIYFHAIVEKNRRASTYYALTNQRAILAYSLRVLAYPILPQSRFTLKKGRFDTVLFAVNSQTGVQQGSSLRGVGFGHLDSGDEVYALTQKTQKDLIKNQGGGLNGP